MTVAPLRHESTDVRWPQLLTLAAVLIFYTNAAVIAVQYHGAPFFVGAGLMLLPAIPAFYFIVIRRQQIILAPALPAVLLFVGAHLPAALHSERPEVSFGAVVAVLTEGIVPFLLFTNVVRTPKMLQSTIWTLLVAGAAMGGLSLYQQVTASYERDFGGFGQMSNAAFNTDKSHGAEESQQPRLAGPIGEQNRYAQIMLMLVPLGVVQAFSSRSVRLRMLAATLTVLTLIGMALTFSRGAAIGLGVLLLAMAWMRIVNVQRLVGIALAVLLVSLVVPQYRARLNSLVPVIQAASGREAATSEADGSIRSRLTEMSAGLHLFIEHPLIGVGPGMYRFNYHDYAAISGSRLLTANRRAHCLYVELAAELGLFGLATFAAVLWITLRNLFEVRNRCRVSDPAMAAMAAAFILALITYLTTSVFLHASYIRYFWFMLALANATACIGLERLPALKAAVAPAGRWQFEGVRQV